MSEIVPAPVSTSPRFKLDGVNWAKIGKGFLINLAGAALTYLAVNVIPGLQDALTQCQTNVAVPCETSQLWIWAIGFAPAVVNFFKELLTDYQSKANQLKIANLGR